MVRNRLLRALRALFLLIVPCLMPALASAGDFDVRKRVEYARHDGVSLVGDLYIPREPGKYPAVVAIHGGGWQNGNPDNYQFWGAYLASRGYVVFSATYRLVKGAKLFPESVHDVRAAVQYVRAKAADLKVDPERIGMMGDSAGGHLVAMVGLAGDDAAFQTAYRDDANAAVSTKVKAVIAAYGVYDMAQQWSHDVLHRPADNIVEKYLGVPPMEDRKLYFDASPMSYVTRAHRGVSFLLANGTEDDVVDRQQTDAFFLALKQAGNYVRRYVMTGAGHYWLTGDPIEEPGSVSGQFSPRVLRFLAERL